LAETTDVFLITGFLGSGKTTLLNRLIKDFPRDKKLMVLMNEFGEIGIDGSLLVGDDYDLLEISKGSIFCVCVKTDFIKALYRLGSEVKPDALLIESTGVANPTDLKRDLKLPIFNNRFVFREQICLVDAAHFLDAFGVFSSVEDQIATSTVFVINKMDLAGPERVQAIKDVIRSHHPDPMFYETSYGAIDSSRLLKWSDTTGMAQEVGITMTDEELEQYIDKLLEDPGASLKPPELLISATFKWEGDVLKEIDELGTALPGAVPRVKGFVLHAEDTYLLDYVMGQYGLQKVSPNPGKFAANVLVVIAPPTLMAEVEDIMRQHHCFRTQLS